MDAAELDRYRSYLRIIARAQLGPRLQAKVDASDLVQETLIRAHEGLGEFRGDSPAQVAAWLRKILARKLAHAARDFGRDRRDVARECSLEAAVHQSSARLEAYLAADQSSPSQQVERNEEILRLAGAIDQLPDRQREAIELHYLQGLTIRETATAMGRAPASVAGLIHRGLQNLRRTLE